MPTNSKTHLRSFICLALGLWCIGTPAAFAVSNNSWTNTGSGFWQDGANWNLGTPGNVNSIYIANNGNYTVTIDNTTADTGSPSTWMSVSNLYMNSGPGQHTLEINFTNTARALTILGGTTQGFSIGNGSAGGTATVLLVNGQLNANSTTNLSFINTVIGNSSLGQLIMSTGTFVSPVTYIGNASTGNGDFEMYGGTSTIRLQLNVGSRAGATGTVLVAGGLLNLTGEPTALDYIGNSGFGQMTISGGTVIDRIERLGQSAGGVGYLTINSGFYTNTAEIDIGLSGYGQVTMNGGVFFSPLVYVCRGSGGLGQFTITGGVATVTGTLYVGDNASGTGNVSVADSGILELKSNAAITLGNASSGLGSLTNENGGTLRFTGNINPIITKTAGSTIVVSNAIVEFKDVNGASIAGNIANITYLGNNTLSLNNATNAAVSSYTFQTNNAPNFAALRLINGNTAWQGSYLTIGSGGSMLISSTTATISGLITNSGSMSVVGATATFTSQVYNRGTNTMLNSVTTFNSGVVNAGTWITDPTTNIFQSVGFTNTGSGVIHMSAGDVYIFTNTAGKASNFINVSTNAAANNLSAGKLLFSGGLGLTQIFTVAGIDLGAGQLSDLLTATNRADYGGGFSNDFAVGTLQISSYSTVRVTDAFSLLGPGSNDNQMAGLYLDNLIMGKDSLLIIDTNVQVYFENSNGWTSANIQLVGNAGFNNALNGIHAIIPEPNVLVLVLGGMLTIFASRRRHRRR